MTSSAISAQGSALAINVDDADPTVWTKVKNVKSYSGFDGSATSLDTTDLDSVAKENLLGLQDWGSFSIDINIDYSDPGQAAMLASKRASTKKNYQLTLPSGDVATFLASVTSFPIAGGTDALLTATVAMAISGDVTITPPAPPA
ncbi:phage tail tube protein [Paraburkholderia sp. BCC1885]|uniref:phage tail tube protein n=1 Tax=Paraburkholderia sp. BCC1885 TaxID=2562669 RepID=UPI001182D5E1|nr:phage tail tube protein [Paraburkholderia sp. BCC1885]